MIKHENESNSKPALASLLMKNDWRKAMFKLLNESDISKIAHLEEEVQTYAQEALTILDEEYGTDRDPITDLGGYVVIIENLDDIQKLEELHNIDLTKNPCPEFMDFIYPEKGPRYTGSLRSFHS